MTPPRQPNKTPHGVSRTSRNLHDLLDASKMAPGASKTAPRWPKRPSRREFNRFLDVFWKQNGWNMGPILVAKLILCLNGLKPKKCYFRYIISLFGFRRWWWVGCWGGLGGEAPQPELNARNKFPINTNIDVRCLDGPQMIPGSKTKFKTNRFFHEQNRINHCFAINEYLEHELDYKTYLELKISSGAFDCLNITSVALPGCSFVPKQGPKHSHGANLYLDISVGAFDCLNFTSISLLGCSSVPGHGP